MRAGPFAYAPFRWLLAARTTSILGNAVAPLALAFAVLDLTGSATDLGLVVATRSLANVAVLLLGGVIADRLPRHAVLVVTSMAAALTQGVVAYLVLSDRATVFLLVILGLLNGAVSAINFPASAALVPQTVPAAQLRGANTFLRLGLNSGSVVGAAVGAVLVAAVGPGAGLAVDAASFALAGILFAFVRTPGREKTTPSDPAGSSVLRDLRQGWKEFASRRWVWVVVAQFGLVNAAFVGAVSVLGPVIADRTFGRAGWGLVVSAETVGLVIGGIVALRWKPRHALAVGVGLTALGSLSSFALAALPLVPVLVIAFLIGGIAFEQFGIAWDQSLQQNIPVDRLARVYSYDALGSFVAIPVGEALAGPLSHVFGTEPTLIGCGVIIVLASAAAFGVRGVRRLEVVRTTEANAARE